MSKESSDMLANGIGILCTVAAVIGAIWFVAWGTGKIIHSMTYVSPETAAQIEQENKEWETDPRNPKVAGQYCLDRGGIPTYSAWDGRLKDCKGSNGKSVNIEVNQ